MFEVVGRLLYFVLLKHIAVSHFPVRAVGPYDVIDAIDALQVHSNALDAIGDLASHRVAFQPPNLLEIGELGDLHAVQPDFPAQPPSAEGGRFPVVFHEANIVDRHIDTQAF